MSIPFASAFSVALRVTVAFVTVASVTVASLTSTQFFSECGCVAQQKLQQNQPSDSKSPMISIGSTLALHGVMSVNVVDYNPLTRSIIEAAIEVHKNTGAGMLESVYMPCLQFELKVRGLRFLAQHPIPIVYKGQRLDASYRIDLIVEDVVVVELKSVEAITPVHEAQILTYMRLAQCPVGLLMNFNVPRLVDGVKRKVNAKAVVRGDGGNGNRGDGGNGNTQSNEGN